MILREALRGRARWRVAVEFPSMKLGIFLLLSAALTSCASGEAPENPTVFVRYYNFSHQYVRVLGDSFSIVDGSGNVFQIDYQNSPNFKDFSRMHDGMQAGCFIKFFNASGRGKLFYYKSNGKTVLEHVVLDSYGVATRSEVENLTKVLPSLADQSSTVANLAGEKGCGDTRKP